MPDSINFFNETGNDFLFEEEKLISAWIDSCIKFHQGETGDINYIFVSPEEIIQINTQYLNHTYPTDIITFNYNVNNVINADIYICPDIVKENSIEYDETYINEFRRVLIHGILHLVGYNDQDETEKKLMREKENEWLKNLNIK